MSLGMEVAVISLGRNLSRGKATGKAMMTVRKTGQGVLIPMLFLSFAAPAVAAFAAREAVSPQKPLRHEVAVTLKLIQVYVTDKNGKPAMDLGRADFRLFDNGQPVTITDFEVYRSEETPPRPSVPSGNPEAVAAQPVPPSKPASAVPAAQMGRKFFFFFDLDSNDLPGIAKARAAALHFLDTAILPADEVGVFSYAFMSGLVMHAFLTTDHARVREAVLRVRDVPGRGSGGTGGADTPGIVVSGQEGQPVVAVIRSSGGAGAIYANRMAALAKALRYIPGTKNILYFSQGGSISSREVRERVEETGREYAAANAPLYTVNTETPDPFNPSGSKGEAALALVARQSGGKAYPDIGAISRFPEIAAEIQVLTRNYYVLGFPVRESWDGKYHKIKVEVGRGDYSVQAQSGYYNPKPFKDYSDVEKDLHLFDLALSERPPGRGPLLFPMRTLQFGMGGESRLLLMSQIPPGVIAKFAGRRIELATLVLNDRDDPVLRRETRPDPGKVRGRDVVFTSEAVLGPGAYRCRIILRDLETGDAVMAYASVTIPAKPGGGLRLFSPLLLTSYRPTVSWEAEARGGNRRWTDVYGYDPAKYSLLAGDIPPGTRSIAAIVPYTFSAISGGDVSLRAALIEASTGSRIEVPCSVVAKAMDKGRAARLLELGLDGIPPAKYLLYIYGEDVSTRAVSYTQTALTIH
jgi:VWFA-related protein